jgi:hypothetical protein
MARIEEDFETVRQALMDRYGYAAPGDDPWDALSRIEAAFVGDYVRELQQERDTLKAEVKNLKFVKDANVEAKQELLEEVERLNHEIELRETARMNHERDIERLREERYELERRITRYRKGLKLDAWLFYPESWEYKRATAVLEEDTE